MHVRVAAASGAKAKSSCVLTAARVESRGGAPEHARKAVATAEKRCDGVLSLCFLNLHCGSLPTIALSLLLLGVVLFACATIELDYCYIIF
jgi:hypothetical protein